MMSSPTPTPPVVDKTDIAATAVAVSIAAPEFAPRYVNAPRVRGASSFFLDAEGRLDPVSPPCPEVPSLPPLLNPPGQLYPLDEV